jgi:hypothetical protein
MLKKYMIESLRNKMVEKIMDEYCESKSNIHKGKVASIYQPLIAEIIKKLK